MKMILEVDLDENKRKAENALMAEEMALCLWDIDNWLRDQIKYHDRHELDDVRDAVREMIEDRGLQLDRMVQ